jgi:hypothetical protein
MSIKLESFQYLPRGENGWTSGILHFGGLLTVVQGPNGTGKTPIMKGIMQGLGHEVELPPEILEHCEFSQMTISVDGQSVTLTRRLSQDFDIRVKGEKEDQTFSSQAEYAKWFIGLFTEDSLTLTTKQNQPTELYPNLLFPALWVDQDHGWTTDYWTPLNRNFIQDQRNEVIRFLVGLPPRHPFRSRSEFDAAKESLERIEKTIEMQRFVVERLRSNEQLADDEQPRLLERQQQLKSDLEANTEVIEAIRSTTVVFDRQLAALEQQRDDLTKNESILSRRKGQLKLVLSEVDGEEDVLAANVQATDLLRQFCGHEDCKMFANSERSFGRSLLFLKDQIKDLEASDRDISNKVEQIGQYRNSLDEQILQVRRRRDIAVKNSPQAEVSAKLGAITKELVAVELRLAKLQQYETERTKFERLLDQREQASAAVAAARPTGLRGVNAISDVRQQLGDSMQQWLATLRTQNTRTAHFDDDFVLYVDGSKFGLTTHQSGSTRTRIVLAFHAALLEVSLDRGGNHPGWLLFDAPKQHELNQADFDSYARRLQLVAARYPGRVQLVFSAADLKTQLEATDEMWIPNFLIHGEPRFLGPKPAPEG